MNKNIFREIHENFFYMFEMKEQDNTVYYSDWC